MHNIFKFFLLRVIIQYPVASSDFMYSSLVIFALSFVSNTPFSISTPATNRQKSVSSPCRCKFSELQTNLCRWRDYSKNEKKKKKKKMTHGHISREGNGEDV